MTTRWTGLLAIFAVSVALLGGTGVAHAQTKKITRLGNPATRFTPPIRNVAALQKTFSDKRVQASVNQVLDKAGLSSLSAQVLAALTEGKVTETTVAPGTGIRWMALKRRGRADIVSFTEWAGPKPFEAFTFKVQSGVKVYTFVVPEACGNLALIDESDVPLPECVHVAMNRQCEPDQVTFTASGTAITNGQATKVTILRDGTQVGELLPGSSFRTTVPGQPGRYTFSATDTYGRSYGTCERDLAVEACAPKQVVQPEPPPAPTSCGALLTANPVKGGWDLVIDGSASAAGASPAARVTVAMVGPDGAQVTFTYQGAPRTEAELSPPFQATFFVPNAKPGTYTLRGRATSGNPKAEARSCESTVVVPAPEKSKTEWFVDGAFGKQRRQYEMAASSAPPSGGAAATITPAFCDPMVGIKGGPLFWFKEDRVSVAPAAGIAFMFGDLPDELDFEPNDYNNVAFFLEGVVNYHFQPRGAFIGTGLGWWDVFDGDHNTGYWLVDFGVPVRPPTDRNQLLFIGEGRLFFDSPDGVDNNYQLWGGLRYAWR